MESMARTYVCDECGKVFESEDSDEKAVLELRSNFGPNVKVEDCGVVCDECYANIMARLNN